MRILTGEGRQAVSDAAQRYGVSDSAAETLLYAIAAGGGRMAQFSHPDLGGMGQWSQGGMIMVGDMFNNALKARVDGLCNDLAGLLASGRRLFEETPVSGPAASFSSQSQYQGFGTGGGFNTSGFGSGVMDSGQWWPTDLGSPASTGAQNDMRYACFPDQHRLVIEIGGQRTVYDTGEHYISGFSQQQSGGQSLTFTSQFGPVPVSSLRIVEGGVWSPPPQQPAASWTAPSSAPSDGNDPLAAIERLAKLRDAGALSEDEFAAKKRELLARI